MNALSDNGSQQEAIDDIKEKIKEEESYLEDEEDEEVRNNIEKLNTALEYLQNVTNVRDETARLLDALGLKGARRLEIEGLITEAKDEANVKNKKQLTKIYIVNIVYIQRIFYEIHLG